MTNRSSYYSDPVGVYVAGPLVGGALAVAVFALLRQRHVLTAKLFHDPRYTSTLASSLPVAPPSTSAFRVLHR